MKTFIIIGSLFMALTVMAGAFGAHNLKEKLSVDYMKIFENISKFLYFKVWEVSGLPYSFYQYYSIHKKKDYEIKENWKEHFKNKCLMPNNQFELGYEFKN